MHTLPILAALAALFVVATQARAQAPGPVWLEGLALQGDGCPPGSAIVDVQPDGQAFTVLFSAYTATAGQSTGRPQERRSCAVDLKLRVPAGWTYALSRVDFRGYALLEPGALGQQASSVTYPPRTALTRLAALDLAGPVDRNYEHGVDVPTQHRIVAPCTGGDTRRVLLRTTLGVLSRRGAEGHMTVDTTDGHLAHTYRLQWHRCPGRAR